tara:strand:+ start:349 stop:657 length:309 start_codon:yes stop_codon:yes gene_type:complete
MAYEYYIVTDQYAVDNDLAIGKYFISKEDKNNFEITGLFGDLYKVEDNEFSRAWVAKHSGQSLTKAEAQSYMDQKASEGQAAYDALEDWQKENKPRPVTITL